MCHKQRIKDLHIFCRNFPHFRFTHFRFTHFLRKFISKNYGWRKVICFLCTDTLHWQTQPISLFSVWHVTPDTWHMTNRMWHWMVNIGSKCQVTGSTSFEKIMSCDILPVECDTWDVVGGRRTMRGTPGREPHMPYQITNISYQIWNSMSF